MPFKVMLEFAAVILGLVMTYLGAEAYEKAGVCKAGLNFMTWGFALFSVSLVFELIDSFIYHDFIGVFQIVFALLGFTVILMGCYIMKEEER